LLPQDISVGQAPLAARFFDDLSEPVRDRTEKSMPCVDDLVRGVLSTLRGRIASRRRTASRRRIRLREGRFGAPRDEGQNEEGGPHHSLHRMLHSRRNACSCRSSNESPSSPSIEFEVKRTTEDMILSSSPH